MATIARKSDPIERIQLVAPATPDRLPAMLILAALIHGILIIGITFNPYILEEFSDAISLEVTIVAEPDQSIYRPDEAEYLAQASQLGGGSTADDAKASAPLERVSPMDNLGVEDGDGEADADATADKIAALRVFPDRKPMDLDVQAIGGGCLVISQFTLAAELRRGNRPDFTAAAPPELAEALYERVAAQLADAGVTVATGRFGAAMQVESCNDGPFSLVLTVRGGKVAAVRPA